MRKKTKIPSLRSKRFGKAFRTFDALFAFLAAGKLGRAQKSACASTPLPRCFHQCCARPNFCAAKSDQRLQPAESPTETLATQATRFLECDIDIVNIGTWKISAKFVDDSMLLESRLVRRQEFLLFSWRQRKVFAR